MSHLVPCHETITAAGTADLFQKYIFCRYGLPEQLITDRGPQFTASILRSLFKTLGILPSLSTAYHPQMDGQSERTNQELEQVLQAFINFQQDNWADLLSFVEFSLNGRRHSATGRSPFYLLYGYEPSYGLDAPSPSFAPSSDDKVAQLRKDRDDIVAALTLATKRMKDYRDRNIGQTAKFKAGNLVWLNL